MPALTAAMEALLMIEPPPWSFMYRAARREPTITPKRFTLMIREKSSRSSGRNRLSGLPTPALLNMMSRPPKRSTAKSTSACT